MTLTLAVDPGLMTGVALGYYSATEPYQLVNRWQVPGGIRGWVDWKCSVGLRLGIQEAVYEKFIFSPDETADYSGVPIEGSIEEWGIIHGFPVIQQDRTHKGQLIGYTPEQNDKASRQRARFDWLESHGLFRAGTNNDDTNDAVCHALISLKLRRHLPTLKRYWGGSRRGATEEIRPLSS